MSLAARLRAGPASIHLAEDPAEGRCCAVGGGPFAGLVQALTTVSVAPFARSALACVTTSSVAMPSTVAESLG